MRKQCMIIVVATLTLLSPLYAAGEIENGLPFVHLGNEYRISLAVKDFKIGASQPAMPMKVKIIRHGGGSWYLVQWQTSSKPHLEFWLNFNQVVTVFDVKTLKD